MLGIEPYFARRVDGPPAYVEFRIGDYQHELGIIDRRFAPHGARRTRPAARSSTGTSTTSQAAFERLLALGATAHDEPTERGPGFVTASVVDPFGNILGVMFNQHYLDMLGAARAWRCRHAPST